MKFNTHSNLTGKHAFLSPSNPSWSNYDSEKLDKAFLNALATKRGIELHEFACDAIRLGVKLVKTPKTVNMYVNDAIGFRMTPEQVLFYSVNAFGTADAICFRNNLLRIHDLKTGDTKASFRQLEIYAALFCLEYEINPFTIQIELRIYQFDEAIIYNADPDEIFHIMDKIISFDKRIDQIKLEADL